MPPALTYVHETHSHDIWVPPAPGRAGDKICSPRAPKLPPRALQRKKSSSRNFYAPFCLQFWRRRANTRERENAAFRCCATIVMRVPGCVWRNRRSSGGCLRSGAPPNARHAVCNRAVAAAAKHATDHVGAGTSRGHDAQRRSRVGGHHQFVGHSFGLCVPRRAVYIQADSHAARRRKTQTA